MARLELAQAGEDDGSGVVGGESGGAEGRREMPQPWERIGEAEVVAGAHRRAASLLEGPLRGGSGAGQDGIRSTSSKENYLAAFALRKRDVRPLLKRYQDVAWETARLQRACVRGRGVGLLPCSLCVSSEERLECLAEGVASRLTTVRR